MAEFDWASLLHKKVTLYPKSMMDGTVELSSADTEKLIKQIDATVKELKSLHPGTVFGMHYNEGYVNALVWVRGIICAMAEGEKDGR